MSAIPNLASVPEPEAPLIYERMAAVLANLPAIGKERRNKDQGFNFRGIEDIVDALHKCLADHQVFYLPRVLARISEQRQTAKGSNLWCVHLHVAFRFYTIDGSYVEATAWGEGTDMADKATSKAMTFAQKTTLLQAFNIATADMDDPDATGVESAPAPEVPWVVKNGWKSQEEHDAYRAFWTEEAKRMTPENRAAFKEWMLSERISPGAAHTRPEADLVRTYLMTKADSSADQTTAPEDQPEEF